MTASFTNFMTGLIDYAGMFPPANLDIAAAVTNYSGYLENNNGWMLGRCIIPVTQLPGVVLRPGFRFSVIVSHDTVQEELDQLGRFKGCVEMVETRVVEETVSPARCSELLKRLKTSLSKIGFQDAHLFVESENVAAAALVIAAVNNSSRGENFKHVGFKLRCGGIKNQAYPSPERVSEIISTCCSHDIPIKFTAGLHHPLSNHSPETGILQYGFINIFAAALLFWNGNISRNEIVECLSDETVGNFHFTRDHFSWRDKAISSGEIQRLRRSRVISFGSCSFSEPVEGLSALGYQHNSGV
jgi:hypothetical protein